MLFLLALPVLLVAVGIAYQWIGASGDLRRIPPPGELVEVDGSKYHVLVRGSGKPTVIFEAGVAASSVSWRPVQELVSQFTTTAAYDRAGFAWSQPSSTKLPSTEVLHQLLAATKLSPPYILVGHSFGGLLARLYADRWPEEICGLLLVDPALLLEWARPDASNQARLRRGIMLSRRGALLARLGVVRFSLAMLVGGSRALPKLLSRLSSGKGHSVSERLVGEVRKLPQELWPAVRSHWCKPEAFESMARHLESLPSTAAAVGNVRPLGSIPVTVISGGHLTSQGHAEHAAIAASSTRGRHIVVRESGHWIHLDAPHLVADEIRAIIEAYS